MRRARRKAGQSLRLLAADLPGAYDASRDDGEAAFAAVRGMEAARAITQLLDSRGAGYVSVAVAHGMGTEAARIGAPATYQAPAVYGACEMEGRARAFQQQSTLLRDIIGNCFRPLPPLAPSLLTWNGGVIRRLALAAYEERLLPDGHLDPARLFVLADAVEEAGGGNELVGHLRQQGAVHVRGCFVVDLLLGLS